MYDPITLHSPEERLNDPDLTEQSVELWVKRDDMIHPFISGNKWRKLRYPIQEMRQFGTHQLVTFGGAWSNHLLACAAAGARFGIKTSAFVRGEPVDNPVLGMCRLFGMKLRFVDRSAYREKKELFARHYDANQAYFLDEGGYGPSGARGCSELIDELRQSYDHIVVAAGTGTTAAGLQQGIWKQQLSTQLHVVPVLKGAHFLLEEIRNLGTDPADLCFHWDYHFSGYAKVKPELLNFIQQFIATTGIMIEPTYTGKMIYAVYDLIRKGYFRRDSRILCIHTGGLTGLLGQLAHFDTIWENPEQ